MIWSLIVRLLASLFGILPRGSIARCGRMVGWVGGRVARIRRPHVVASIARARMASPERIANGMYRSLGIALVEFLAMSPDPVARAGERVVWGAGAEAELERLLASKQGAIVVTGHLANWDLVACALSGRVGGRAPIGIVTKRLHVKGLNSVWQGIRSHAGLQQIAESGAMLEAARVVRAGGIVAMMIDQAPHRGGGVVWHPFLGAAAPCDLAPALIAARTARPLVLVLSHRREDGNYFVEAPLVFPPPGRRDRAVRAWAISVTRELQEALERHVREFPEQWLWLHRRWRGAKIADKSHDLSTHSVRAQIFRDATQRRSKVLA